MSDESQFFIEAAEELFRPLDAQERADGGTVQSDRQTDPPRDMNNEAPPAFPVRSRRHGPERLSR
jgi:hypothetical protein